jgi:alkanesulfonate monooxygenase SsuD/methylene tetrahydromethanopterin reductase-like flavin-dependent oxidoreductase (luciferase family)
LVKFGVGVPNVADFADPVLLVDLAGETEAAGWDGFFVWDHLLYRPERPGAVDAWTVIAAAAALTTQIRVGVLVTAVPRRRPQLLAQQVATIDLLSAGRLVFGVGLGSLPDEYKRFGENPSMKVRGRRLDESLSVLQAMWSRGSLRHRGEFFTVDDVELLPKPAQEPHPPIWVAGRWPNKAPFRRAARFDGVMPTHSSYAHGSFMTVEELREVVDYVQDHRSRNDPFDVVMEGESSTSAHLEVLVSGYGTAGLTWWIEKLGWWRGGPAAALTRIRSGPPS